MLIELCLLVLIVLFSFGSEAGNLTMANIEEEEEEDMVVVEIEPPKRKNIATLKVRGYWDSQFKVQSVSNKTQCIATKDIESNVLCKSNVCMVTLQLYRGFFTLLYCSS